MSDFYSEMPLDSVEIRVREISVFSNSYGEFKLGIPPSRQQPFVTVRAFKEGYKIYEKHSVAVNSKVEMAIPLKRIQPKFD